MKYQHMMSSRKPFTLAVISEKQEKDNMARIFASDSIKILK